MGDTPNDQNQNDNAVQNQNPDSTQSKDSGTKKNKVEERINQLYGQKKAAEEYSAELQNENEKLRSQMLDLQSQMNELKEGNNQTPNTTAGDNLPNDGNAGNLDADGIRKVVEDTVGNVLTKREQQVQQAQQLRQALTQSWQKAVSTYPVLSDENSEMYKAAQQIWENDSKLKEDPNGPFKAAVMARGFIGPDSEPNQQQLNAATQSQHTANENISASDAKSELDQINKELEEVQKQMLNGDNIRKTWPRRKELKARKAELERAMKGK